MINEPLEGQPVDMEEPGCSTAATTSTAERYGSWPQF
jgi:hypothetical protein